MDKTITAIIPSFRRHENIHIIIDRLKNQTHKPKRIIVWNDNSGDYGKDIKLDDESIEVINTNSNWWSNYGSYLIGYLTNTDYIAIIDDDVAPGPEWFEFCVKKQEECGGLYGEYGVTFLTKKGYKPNERYKSKVSDGELIEVDMIGNSYFIPSEAITYMLSEKPPSFVSTCDLHLCYTSQKYGNLKSYVVYTNRKEQLPRYKEEELVYNKSERALWSNPSHFINRNGYVKWAVKHGWNIIKFREN